MGAGLALVGLSLLLMRGLTVTSHWTHLLPALLVGGVGVGLINPPLALRPRLPSSRPVGQAWARGSTAPSARSASPPASPALGSIFTSEVRTHVSSGLHAAHLGGSRAIATAISSGQTTRLSRTSRRRRAGSSARWRVPVFVAGLNEILLVAAVLAVAARSRRSVLIRSSDFVAQTEKQPDGRPAGAPEPARA